MWYGETVWPTLVTLATIAALSGMMWWDRRKPMQLAVVAACVVAAIAAIVIERQIVTPREVVTARLEKLVRDFELRDQAAVVDAISARAPEIQELARRALDKVTISNVRLTDINVEMSGEDVLGPARISGSTRTSCSRNDCPWLGSPRAGLPPGNRRPMAGEFWRLNSSTRLQGKPSTMPASMSADDQRFTRNSVEFR